MMIVSILKGSLKIKKFKECYFLNYKASHSRKTHIILKSFSSYAKTVLPKTIAILFKTEIYVGGNSLTSVMNKIFSNTLMEWAEFPKKHIESRTQINKKQYTKQRNSYVQFLRKKKQKGVLQYHCCHAYQTVKIMQKKFMLSVNLELSSILDVEKVCKGQSHFLFNSMNGKDIFKIV